jgi:hypothetical protein
VEKKCLKKSYFVFNEQIVIRQSLFSKFDEKTNGIKIAFCLSNTTLNCFYT